jgi:antitoxin component YwqK of YwqJK toxin-antitoxin module
MNLLLIATCALATLSALDAHDYSADEVDITSGRILDNATKKPISGTVTRRAEDGTNLTYYEVIDGVQNGKEIQWYPTGVKRSEVTMKDGARAGAWVFWYPSGAIMSVVSSDSFISYAPDGSVADVVIYKDAEKKVVEYRKAAKG